MSAARIYEYESFEEMAKKIFFHFEINQSCTVSGYEEIEGGRLVAKGEQVIAELERLDNKHNMTTEGKVMRRKRAKPIHSIGGYVAHKIWKYRQRIVDSQVKYDIWRIQ